MKPHRPVSIVLACVVFLPALARAASPRTFVSAQHGSDSNPCSLAQPCLSFATAIAATSASGEVIVLDSGSYGNVTISQAVAIEAPAGIYAGISVSSGSGVTIAAGAADVVTLRGLTIMNAGGDNGMTVTSAGTVHIEGCTIGGFAGAGISGIAGGFHLFLYDTLIRECRDGIVLGPKSGAVLASIDRCRIENSGIYGLAVLDNAKASIRDSVISGGGQAIRAVTANPSTSAEINIENCLVANNTTGISAEGQAGTKGAKVRLSNSTVTDNGTGLVIFSPGKLLSRGNNTVEGNTTQNVFHTLGTYSAK